MVAASLVSQEAASGTMTLPVAGCSSRRKRGSQEMIPASDSEATQEMPPLPATPMSRKKKRTEDNEPDPVVCTVSKYFNMRLEEKSKSKKTVSEENAYARHMSNAIYEMLLALPRREQYMACNEFFNIILKYQQ